MPEPIVLTAHGRQVELHTADVAAWSAAYDGPLFHAILTDWPYLLEFLNSRADRPHLDRYKGEQAFRRDVDAVCGLVGWPRWAGAAVLWYRDMARALTPLLHPGALHFGFGGARTFGLLKAGLLGAGWDVHDTVLGWLYGQGEGKGQRIDRMIGRHLGKNGGPSAAGEHGARGLHGGGLAARWAGHRTPSLAPGWEPILMAHTPRQGMTYAEAALTHGAGMINRRLGAVPLDGEKEAQGRPGHWGGDNARCQSTFNASPDGDEYRTRQDVSGRYPRNVILDEAAAALLDAGGPTPRSGGFPQRRVDSHKGWSGGWREEHGASFGAHDGARGGLPNAGLRYGDGRMPSRFFYVAKASRRERDAGLRSDLCYHCWQPVEGKLCPRCSTERRPVRPGRNPHPAVKPIQLATIPAQIQLPPPLDVPRRLLIPCGGSGSETIAAYLAGGLADGWDEIVMVEREAGYVRVAEERLRYWTQFTAYEAAMDLVTQVHRKRQVRQPFLFEVGDA